MLRQWSRMMVVLSTAAGWAALIWFAPAAGLGGLLLVTFLHDRARKYQGQLHSPRHDSPRLDHRTDHRKRGQWVTEAKEAGARIARQRRELGELSGNRPMDLFQ